jgi:hypothetical protein
MIANVALAAAALLAGLAVCGADQKSFDCKMKQLGLDFAQSLQPWRPLVCAGRPRILFFCRFDLCVVVCGGV